MIDEITPLLITFNEAPNIARTLAPLGWARRIVVIDSGSTDGTLEILAAHPNVEVIQRPFVSFADQCNFGLDQVRTEWVLSLDADYELSAALVEELHGLDPPAEAAGYRGRFVYRMFGRPLRGALYPPRDVLFRARQGRYVDEGHGHRVRISGEVGPLRGVVFHDDRKPLARWLASQAGYARIEATHLLATPAGALSRRDRLRRMGWPAPLLVFAYALLAKGCIFDGAAGWLYAFQRLYAETLLALELLDRRLRPPPSSFQ